MATLDQTMMRVQRLLTGPLGLRVQVSNDGFEVRFKDISTVLHIRVREWGTDDAGEPQTIVLLSAPILQGVGATPDLFEWVARNGGSRLFGHIEVYDDDAQPGSVFLLASHTLLGDYLDEKELESAMMGVLSSADAWDDDLQQRFGGKRWIDS